MEAKNESTLHFAEKIGDKLFIEISITGNPDEVVNKIMKSILKGDELFEWARCEQILFKGRSVDTIIKNATEKAVKQIKDLVIGIEEKMRYGKVDTVTGA